MYSCGWHHTSFLLIAADAASSTSPCKHCHAAAAAATATHADDNRPGDNPPGYSCTLRAPPSRHHRTAAAMQEFAQVPQLRRRHLRLPCGVHIETPLGLQAVTIPRNHLLHRRESCFCARDLLHSAVSANRGARAPVLYSPMPPPQLMTSPCRLNSLRTVERLQEQYCRGCKCERRGKMPLHWLWLWL